MKQQEIHLQRDVNSELLSWHALQRRSLAYDLCQVLSYQVAMEWLRYLFDHLHRAAAPGYTKPDLTAILRADRQAWIILAEEFTTFSLDADGAMPLDKRLLELKMHPEVAFHLLPRPGGGTKRASDGEPKPSPAPVQPKQPYKPKGGGKTKSKGSKGKGRNKGAPRAPPMPRELLGHAHLSKSGEPICFDYNLPHGCDRAKVGARCSKGVHICCKKGCGKPHTLSEHKE